MPPLPFSAIQNMIGLPTSYFCAETCSDAATQEGFEAIFANEELKAIEECGELYPYAREMLQSIRQTGITMAICSNGSRIYLDHACAHTGITEFFSIIDCEHVGTTKSEAAAKLLKRLGAKGGFLVGDRALDIAAAHDNGLISVGIAVGYGGDEIYQANFVARDHKELEQILLQQINNR